MASPPPMHETVEWSLLRRSGYRLDQDDALILMAEQRASERVAVKAAQAPAGLGLEGHMLRRHDKCLRINWRPSATISSPVPHVARSPR